MIYAKTLLSKASNYWPRIALVEQLSMGSTSSYVKYLNQWKSKTNCFLANPHQIRQNVMHYAVKDVMEMKRHHVVSTFAMNEPRMPFSSWFKPKKWVSDSALSKMFAEFRVSNTGLGNRAPSKDGIIHKMCPLCSRNGITALNNEVYSRGCFKLKLLPLRGSIIRIEAKFNSNNLSKLKF